MAKESKAVVQYKGEAVTITRDDIKNLICPLATTQEVAVFLKTCQTLNLNPFADEIYLIKYSEREKASTVIAIDSYLAAGEANPQFDGHEAGIILKEPTGKLDFREGAFLLDEERERLVGGWARVFRKDRSHPFYVAVNRKECLRYRRDGSLTEFWIEEKQPWMLRKVALKRSLVEAFPSLFSGISDADYETLPAEVKEVLPEPKGETPEGELPPVMEREGKPDWPKFWAKVRSELGLWPVQARERLHVASIKQELIDAGWTMDQVWDALIASLDLEKATPDSDQTQEEPPKPMFQNWGEFAAAAINKGVSPSEVFARAKVKTWGEFGEDYWTAWAIVDEIAREKAQKKGG